MPKKKTHEEYQNDIRELFGEEYEVVSQYTGSKKPVTLYHKTCGYTWTAKPAGIRLTNGCPKCTQLMVAKQRVIPQEVFLQRLNEKHPNIEMIGEYVDYTTPVEFKCKIDGNIWTDTPLQVIKLKYSCKVCAGIKVMPGYNSFNDIKPNLAQYLVNYEAGFKYTANSKHKLTFRCPHCGQLIDKWLNNIYDDLHCNYCHDGVSYPEKFFYSFLKQIYNQSDIQKQFLLRIGSKTYRYDFYIKSQNIMFEVHGLQHYEEGFTRAGGLTLEEVIANDALKKELAVQQQVPIENYIVIDARKSNMEFIKNSILSHTFFKSFDLSNINWEQCGKDALTSLMIQSIDLFNKGKTQKEIADTLGVCKITIRNYLRKGAELHLCAY